MLDKILEAFSTKLGWLVINRTPKQHNFKKSVIVVNDALIIQVTRSKGGWMRLAFKDIGDNYTMVERWELFCERNGIDPDSLDQFAKKP